MRFGSVLREGGVKSVGGMQSPVPGVSSVALMNFAVRHDVSFPALVAFVRFHRRLPHNLTEFEAHRQEALAGVAPFAAIA